MTDDLDQLAINTIRTLAMDAVQKANSGHPGMPMAMAPAAFHLFAQRMHHDPADPKWPNRDRFVLSAGHGSMLLYASLHLSGYELPMSEIERFRQWGSLTPGHPERDLVHVTPGVEVTTGPLGQGFANGIGMAIAERFLRDRYGTDVCDHRVYAIVSDGDLMEGIASEAASLAGHLGLGRVIYLYDDNDISLDGPTSLAFSTEHVTERFEAYGWQVLAVHDANDLTALSGAIEDGVRHEDRPTLIRVKSIIGYPSPNKMGTSKAHGAALGEDEVRLTKEALGWDPDAHFLVPDGVYDHFSARERGAAAHAEWTAGYEAWKADHADAAAEYEQALTDRPAAGVTDALTGIEWGKDKLATRSAGQRAMEAFGPFVPTMLGGAADLTESTKTLFPGDDAERFTREHSGRNVFFGVREHGMGGIVNGMAAHGAIVRPYGSTFLQFTDYMRGAIRLSALSSLNVAWVYTHDSVALGEDGPTHQPVEHLAALRAIPELVVFRPGDANETAYAWLTILRDLDGPALMALSRQDLPVQAGASAEGVARGAYVIREANGDEQACVVGTGGELWVAIAAAEQLESEGIGTRVVSMPSWELFRGQDDDYRESVIPAELPSVSVEAGVSMGWSEWVDASVSIDRFGASAPGQVVLEKLGITPAHVVATVKELLV